MSPDKPICLGVITGASGVRGEVRIKAFTSEPKAVGAYGEVTTKEGKRFKLSNLKAVKAGLTARLDSVTDRDAALALKGTELFVARAKLPKPQEEEFYHVDLIGLTARTKTGEDYGRVKAVHDFGAGDLLEIQLAAQDGSKQTEVFVSFTKQVVPEIHVEDGFIVVDPPEEDEEAAP